MAEIQDLKVLLVYMHVHTYNLCSATSQLYNIQVLPTVLMEHSPSLNTICTSLTIASTDQAEGVNSVEHYSNGSCLNTVIETVEEEQEEGVEQVSFELKGIREVTSKSSSGQEEVQMLSYIHFPTSQNESPLSANLGFQQSTVGQASYITVTEIDGVLPSF